MAQPSEREFSPLQLCILLIGAGVVTTVVSFILIQFIPIRLFVAGLIVGPVMMFLGILAPLAAIFERKPKGTILLGEPASEMVTFVCRFCPQRYVCASSLKGTEFRCQHCQALYDIEVVHPVTDEEWREATGVK